MDKLTIRKEIAALVNSIKEHSDNIANSEQIPQLEFELILHKIEKLYKKSIVYNHLNTVYQETSSTKTEEKITILQPITESPKIEVTKQEIKQAETRPEEIIDNPTDLFGSELPPVTEKLKPERKTEKKEEKQITNKIQKPAISDINKAIGINDKFQFANELFEGNMQEYNIALQQLNNAETYESAMDYFSNLQQLYEWDIENETVKRLMDLIERRYS